MTDKAFRIWTEHLRILEIKSREIRHIPLRVFVPWVERRIDRSKASIRDLLRYHERRQDLNKGEVVNGKA